jgi:hypothetical protein
VISRNRARRKRLAKADEDYYIVPVEGINKQARLLAAQKRNTIIDE